MKEGFNRSLSLFSWQEPISLRSILTGRSWWLISPSLKILGLSQAYFPLKFNVEQTAFPTLRLPLPNQGGHSTNGDFWNLKLLQSALNGVVVVVGEKEMKVDDGGIGECVFPSISIWSSLPPPVYNLLQSQTTAICIHRDAAVRPHYPPITCKSLTFSTGVVPSSHYQWNHGRRGRSGFFLFGNLTNWERLSDSSGSIRSAWKYDEKNFIRRESKRNPRESFPFEHHLICNPASSSRTREETKCFGIERQILL